MSLSHNVGNRFDPVDFYRLASELYRKRDPNNNLWEPVLYRTIINRAYYAAFLTAREAGDIKNTGGNAHAQVIAYWKSKQARIANRLSDLKDYREMADYQLDSDITQRETGKALKLSKEILQDLNIQI